MVDWKPVLTMLVQNSTSQPLSCTRLCLDTKPSSTTRLVLGSLDGEMAVVDANVRGVSASMPDPAAFATPGLAQALCLPKLRGALAQGMVLLACCI